MEGGEISIGEQQRILSGWLTDAVGGYIAPGVRAPISEVVSTLHAVVSILVPGRAESSVLSGVTLVLEERGWKKTALISTSAFTLGFDGGNGKKTKTGFHINFNYIL